MTLLTFVVRMVQSVVNAVFRVAVPWLCIMDIPVCCRCSQKHAMSAGCHIGT